MRLSAFQLVLLPQVPEYLGQLVIDGICRALPPLVSVR